MICMNRGVNYWKKKKLLWCPSKSFLPKHVTDISLRMLSTKKHQLSTKKHFSQKNILFLAKSWISKLQICGQLSLLEKFSPKLLPQQTGIVKPRDEQSQHSQWEQSNVNKSFINQILYVYFIYWDRFIHTCMCVCSSCHGMIAVIAVRTDKPHHYKLNRVVFTV